MSGYKYRPLSRRLKPSEYRSPADIDWTKEKKNRNYPFSERINRLRFEEQIRPLFDNPDKVKENRTREIKYNGKIAGVPARIYFNKSHSCSVHVKDEECLKEVYNEVKKRLSKLLENELDF